MLWYTVCLINGATCYVKARSVSEALADAEFHVGMPAVDAEIADDEESEGDSWK